jgi:hypothetical protein
MKCEQTGMTSPSPEIIPTRTAFDNVYAQGPYYGIHLIRNGKKAYPQIQAASIMIFRNT